MDSFNRSFDFDIPLKTGRLVPGEGWVASDYIGIDQGPILAMIANYRNGFVWEVMKKRTTTMMMTMMMKINQISKLLSKNKKIKILLCTSFN